MDFDIFEIINDPKYQDRFKGWIVSSGRSTCCCPFHSKDNTPSFMVYHETSSFYCYGCKVGGGPVQLLQSLEQVDLSSAKLLFDGYLTFEKKLEMTLKSEAKNLNNDDINTKFSSFCRKITLRKPELLNQLDIAIIEFDRLLQSEPETYILQKKSNELIKKITDLL